MTDALNTSVLFDERTELDLSQLCAACAADMADIIALIEEGMLEPLGDDRDQWRFSVTHLRYARVAIRLHRDLGVNPPGAALAVHLLQEIEQLRRLLKEQT